MEYNLVDDMVGGESWDYLGLKIDFTGDNSLVSLSPSTCHLSIDTISLRIILATLLLPYMNRSTEFSIEA